MTLFPPVALRAPALLGLAALLGLVGALGGCNLHGARAKALEAQNRWEEAAIEYHLAGLKDPGVEEYQQGLARANKAVARENFALYKEYLAKKEFKKAYQRLSDAERQDPTFREAAAESAKWMRVLVAGRVRFDFESLRANVSLADEISLTARINTPNPGEVIEAEIDLDSGTFFEENLLYDRPNQMLTFYTLNAIGVELVFSRGGTRQFRTRNFQRFINFSTPVLDSVSGELNPGGGETLEPVERHRGRSAPFPAGTTAWEPSRNPHYALEIAGNRILVSARGRPFHFTPRFLYLNHQDRRLFVDFGAYHVSLDRGSQKWAVSRVPLTEGDYFPTFSQNIALQPYFFYREGVYSYAPAGAG